MTTIYALVVMLAGMLGAYFVGLVSGMVLQDAVMKNKELQVAIDATSIVKAFRAQKEARRAARRDSTVN